MELGHATLSVSVHLAMCLPQEPHDVRQTSVSAAGEQRPEQTLFGTVKPPGVNSESSLTRLNTPCYAAIMNAEEKRGAVVLVG